MIGPKYQRGSVSVTAFANAAQQGVAGEVAVTDILVEVVTAGGGSCTGVSFIDSGELEQAKVTTTTWSALEHNGEWWTLEPVASVGDDYEVRCESIDSGSTFNQEPAAVGTYTDMVATNTIQWNQCRGVKAGVGTTETVATFQIRLKASPFTVLDTFEVHLRSERTA